MQNPSRVIHLLQDVAAFQPMYERLQTLPKSIVPQDAHPFNFFIHKVDGKVSMLDLEDLSLDARIADISTVYLFKILRGLVQKSISQEVAIAHMKSVIEGYNSAASEPLSQEELELMMEYARGVFLNFLPQFGIIMRMDPKELDAYNPGMSLDSFLSQFTLLENISISWNRGKILQPQ